MVHKSNNNNKGFADWFYGAFGVFISKRKKESKFLKSIMARCLSVSKNIPVPKKFIIHSWVSGDRCFY